MLNNAIKIVVDFLGCKLNQAEIESLALDFARAGYRLVLPGQKADICVINTCTVTHIADRKSRQWLRRMRRINPRALLVATGCYAQRAAAELMEIDTNLMVVDNSRKMDMVTLLGQLANLTGQPVVETGLLESISRTRSFIRIQEGCSGHCSYCIVPSVRNQSSRPVLEILAEISFRVELGYKEVVLTGTEIGEYQSDGIGLRDLIKTIMDRTSIQRLRISSLQPQEIEEPLLELWSDERLCSHFHLSLQSGSDSVLARMKRRYTTTTFISALEKLRRLVPGAAITTDIIAGFPGETLQEFEQTLNFCRNQGFARIHVFPYSKRPGTLAAGMPGQLGVTEIKNRVKTLLELSARLARDFMTANRGHVFPVLWEARCGGFWTGLTPNYIRVYYKSEHELANCISCVRLGELYRDGVKGEQVQQT